MGRNDEQGRPGRLPDVGPWDVWCRRFGIDPNTADEQFVDAYLHNRAPAWPRLEWRDHHQRDAYGSWDAYDRAVEAMSALQRRAQEKAEVYELERWWPESRWL